MNKIIKRTILSLCLIGLFVYLFLYGFYYPNFGFPPTRHQSLRITTAYKVGEQLNLFFKKNNRFPKNIEEITHHRDISFFKNFNYERTSFIGISNISKLPKENDKTLSKDIDINIIQFDGYKKLNKEIILYYVSPKLDWCRLYGVDNNGYFITFKGDNYIGSKH